MSAHDPDGYERPYVEAAPEGLPGEAVPGGALPVDPMPLSEDPATLRELNVRWWYAHSLLQPYVGRGWHVIAASICAMTGEASYQEALASLVAASWAFGLTVADMVADIVAAAGLRAPVNRPP